MVIPDVENFERGNADVVLATVQRGVDYDLKVSEQQKEERGVQHFFGFCGRVQGKLQDIGEYQNLGLSLAGSARMLDGPQLQKIFRDFFVGAVLMTMNEIDAVQNGLMIICCVSCIAVHGIFIGVWCGILKNGGSTFPVA